MSYKKSFHDVSREINEEPNDRVNRTNQGFFSAFWEHDPTPRIGNFRVVLYKIGEKHTL